MINQILLLCVLIIIGLFVPASTYAQIKPNIVVFMADDLGYGDIGPYNSQVDYTPNLDSLASESVMLTNFYVPVSVCTPSRASIMTGLYPVRYDLNAAIEAGEPGLPTGYYTLAEALQDCGYETAITGKWHLGDSAPFFPTEQGFDRWYGTPYSNSVDPYLTYRNGAVDEQYPDQATLTDKITAEAVSFIETASEPFFLYIPYTFPHIPQFSPDEGQTGQGIYADSVADIDSSVGRVLGALDARGLADNTIVIFTSDNGPRDVEHLDDAAMMANVTAKMPYLVDWQDLPGYGDVLNPDRWHGGSLANDIKPFRGPVYRPDGSILARAGKSSVYEGGLNVPFLIRWPGHLAPHIEANYVIMMDLYSTLITLAGGQPIANDGQDIWLLLQGQPRTEPFLAHLYHTNGDYKAIRWSRYKLIFRWGNTFEPQWLYDIKADPAETTNIISQYPNLAQWLTNKAIATDEDMRPGGE